MVVRTKRMTLIKKGVTNLNKLPTYRKYNIKKTRATSKNANKPKGAPNPWAPKYTWAPWGTKGVEHDNCYDYAFGSYSPNRTSKSVPGDRSKIGSNGMTFTTCNGIAKRVISDNPGNVYKMRNPNSKPKPGFYKVMCFVAPSNDFGNTTGDFHWYKEISSIRYKTRPGDTIAGLAKFFRVTPAVIKTALAKARSTTNANNGRVANKNSDLHVLNKYNELGNSKIAAGKVIDFPVKLWSHKTGWAGGPLIIDASGKTIIDPRKADRNYKPGFHYTKFCSAYGVRRGHAKTGNNANRNGKINSNSVMVNRVL